MAQPAAAISFVSLSIGPTVAYAPLWRAGDGPRVGTLRPFRRESARLVPIVALRLLKRLENDDARLYASPCGDGKSPCKSNRRSAPEGKIMRSEIFRAAFAAFALFSLAAQPAKAGRIGEALNELGMDEQAQNLGDTLDQLYQAAATRGRNVRGASGALGQILYNSGSLICDSWIIAFRIKIRNLIINSTNLEGDALTQQLEIIRKSQEFADKIEAECSRMGFLGTPMNTGGGSSAGTPSGAGTTGDDNADGEDEDPHGVRPRPGETVADAICRQKCEKFYRAMHEEERRLKDAESLYDNAKSRAETANRNVKNAEAKLAQARADLAAANKVLHTTITGTPTAAQSDNLLKANDKRKAAERTISELEDDLPDLRADAKSAEDSLKSANEGLNRQLKRTQDAVNAYNDCIKKCAKQAAMAGEEVHICLPSGKVKDPREPINVGPNGKVGSGARRKEKLKGAVGGLLKKAVGVGGSGGGGKGPKTDRDPVKKKKKVAASSADGKSSLRAGARFYRDSFLVSADITDSPDNGTFQTIYLQGEDGRVMAPVAYYLYQLYRKWSLTVSWTYDRWVDNQNVEHREGQSHESWTEDLGIFSGGGEAGANENSIWYKLGFDNASHGAKAVGAGFPLTEEMLEREPVNIIVHVTRPSQDPVTTTPFIFLAEWGEDGVKVTPAETPLFPSPCF